MSCKLNRPPRRWAVRMLCCGYGCSKAATVLQSILHDAEVCSCCWSQAAGEEDSVGFLMVNSFSHLGQVNDSLSQLQVWDLVSSSACVRWLSSFSVAFKHVLTSKGNTSLGAFVNPSGLCCLLLFFPNQLMRFFINVVPAFGLLTSAHSTGQCSDWVEQLHCFISCRQL